MILDFQQVSMAGGMIVFPDWPHAAQPLPDSEMHETVFIVGSSPNSQNIIGDVDSPGN